MIIMHDAVWSLKKTVYQNNRVIHSIYPEVSVKIEEQDKKGELHIWFNLLPELKEIGMLKIVACAQMMDIFNLTKEDLVDFVDEIAGVTYFTSEAENAENIITIG